MIITINPGSATIKIALYELDGHRLAGRHRISASIEQQPEAMLKDLLAAGIINNINDIKIVAHRVVHGGPNLTSHQIIDEEVVSQIESAVAFAPLHNPKSLTWIEVCRKILGPKIAQVAIMDTEFFTSLPPKAATYALPKDVSHKYGLRRLGFHGLAHLSMWRQFAQKNAPSADSKVITLQLGSGASMAAIKGGRPIDTSMGFTPLEGLVMASRSGDIDPGILLYLLRQGFDVDALEEMLFKRSGLLGLSGMSTNLAELSASNSSSARSALDVYVHRARKYLAAYMAALRGGDAIIFGGGVGENNPAIRKRIIDGFAWCDVLLDEELNLTNDKPCRIDAKDSRAQIWVLPPDEAFEMARAARGFL